MKSISIPIFVLIPEAEALREKLRQTRLVDAVDCFFPVVVDAVEADVFPVEHHPARAPVAVAGLADGAYGNIGFFAAYVKGGLGDGRAVVGEDVSHFGAEKGAVIVPHEADVEVLELVLQRADEVEEGPGAVRLAHVVEKGVADGSVDELEVVPVPFAGQGGEVVEGVGVVEHVRCPVDGDLGEGGELLGPVEDGVLVVAHEDGGAFVPDDGEAFGRLRPVADRVAEADDFVRIVFPDILHDRLKRGEVGVDIGDESHFHAEHSSPDTGAIFRAHP